jgi:lysyl-tRNA synthetase class 1
LIQIAGGDIEKTFADLAANDSKLKQQQLPALKARAERAKYWVENCAPDEFKFHLLPKGGAAALSAEEKEKLRPLSDAEKNAVRILRDDVIKKIDEFNDDKSCAAAIYAAAEKAGIDGKALFGAAYQALIGKEQGPRLANFLKTINKERLLGILERF